MDALSLVDEHDYTIFLPTGEGLAPGLPRGDIRAWKKVAEQLSRNCASVIDALHLKQKIWLGGKSNNKSFRSLMQEYKPKHSTTHERGASGTTEGQSPVERKLGDLLDKLKSAEVFEASTREAESERARQRAQADEVTEAAYSGPDGRRGRKAAAAAAAGAAPPPRPAQGAARGAAPPPAQGARGGSHDTPTGNSGGGRSTGGRSTGGGSGGSGGGGSGGRGSGGRGSGTRVPAHKNGNRRWGTTTPGSHAFHQSPALKAIGMGAKQQKAWIVLEDFEEMYYNLYPPPSELPKDLQDEGNDGDEGFIAKQKVGGRLDELEWRELPRDHARYKSLIDAHGDDDVLAAHEIYMAWHATASAPQRQKAAAYRAGLTQEGTAATTPAPAEDEITKIAGIVERGAQMSADVIRDMVREQQQARAAADADRVVARQEDREDKKAQVVLPRSRTGTSLLPCPTPAFTTTPSPPISYSQREHEMAIEKMKLGLPPQPAAGSSAAPQPAAGSSAAASSAAANSMPRFNPSRWPSVTRMLAYTQLGQYDEKMEEEGFDDISLLVSTMQRDPSGEALTAILKRDIKMKSGHAARIINSFFEAKCD